MDIVIGRVAQVHIDDKVIMDNGKLDIKSIRPIARLGYYDYTVVDEIFEMKAPRKKNWLDLKVEILTTLIMNHDTSKE